MGWIEIPFPSDTPHSTIGRKALIRVTLPLKHFIYMCLLSVAPERFLRPES
jgi:hypothetical protein